MTTKQMITREKDKMQRLKKEINKINPTDLATTITICLKLDKIKPLIISYGTTKAIAWYNQKIITTNQILKNY